MAQKSKKFKLEKKIDGRLTSFKKILKKKCKLYVWKISDATQQTTLFKLCEYKYYWINWFFVLFFSTRASTCDPDCSVWPWLRTSSVNLTVVFVDIIYFPRWVWYYIWPDRILIHHFHQWCTRCVKCDDDIVSAAAAATVMAAFLQSIHVWLFGLVISHEFLYQTLRVQCVYRRLI